MNKIPRRRGETEVCLLMHMSSRCLGMLSFEPDPVHKGPLHSEADLRLPLVTTRYYYYPDTGPRVKGLRLEGGRMKAEG